MSNLFETEEGATFNGAIHCWDVSKVTTMSAMFKGAKAFNQDISGWDVGAVTTMESMFEGAEAFEQDLTAWAEHIQSTVNTASMFAGASKVTTIPDWKADGTKICFAPSAHVNVMADRAELKAKIDDEIAKDANVNLNHIETCNVRDMNGLFKNKATFNGDISQWDVSKVTNMGYMFYDAIAFNQPIGDWNVSNVGDMRYMFYDAIAFNQPIGDWNVGKVENMSYMFYDVDAFNQTIGGWDVSKVTTMYAMFYNASVFEQDLTAWAEHIQSTVNTASMFAQASKVTTIPDWKEAGVCFAPSAHADVMENKAKLQEKINALITVGTPSPDLNHLETCNVTDMSSLFKDKTTFNGAISQWDVSNVKSMNSMFHQANAFDQPIGNWNVSNVEDVFRMFSGAWKFDQPIGDWDVSNVTNMKIMFFGANDFCQDLSSWRDRLKKNEQGSVVVLFELTFTGAATDIDECATIPPQWYTDITDG